LTVQACKRKKKYLYVNGFVVHGLTHKVDGWGVYMIRPSKITDYHTCNEKHKTG